MTEYKLIQSNDGKDTLDRQVNQAQHRLLLFLQVFLNMFKPMVNILTYYFYFNILK